MLTGKNITINRNNDWSPPSSGVNGTSSGAREAPWILRKLGLASHADTDEDFWKREDVARTIDLDKVLDPYANAIDVKEARYDYVADDEEDKGEAAKKEAAEFKEDTDDIDALDDLLG